MKILVTGAAGQMGSTVIETLLKHISAQQISVLTRKEEKRLAFEKQGFNAFLGDYADVVALENAMSGVDTVLLISSGDQGDRMQEHKNVVDAAIKCGVKNMAYTSRSLRDRTTLNNQLMTEHFLTEDYIKQSGLKYIFFQNALYMDVIPQFVGQNVFETGIFQPAGDGKVAYALRSEQSEAMANVLLNEKFENQTYRFTGDAAYSFYDIADALSVLSGKTVKYNAVEVAQYEAMMSQRGLPPFLIKKIVSFVLDIKDGQESMITNDLENKLGRKPVSLKEGLKSLFQL